MENIFQLDLVSWAMDRALASHTVSRINVANVNTKNFVPLKLDFSEQLRNIDSELKSHSSDYNMKFASIDQMMEQNTIERSGETVELDFEVSQMVRSSGYYQSLASIMSRKIGLMRMAVSNHS